MFKQVESIFRENDIKYMICGGTLLGAATTRRFIPWDDDFDVCIFEEDYERAADLLIERLTDHAVLQCAKTDPNYYLGWMKVRDQKSHVYPDAPSFKENGVWIDLYKLVRMKKKEVPYVTAKENIDYLNRRLTAGGLTSEQYQTRLVQGDLLSKQEEAECAMLESNDTEEVYMIWSASKITLDVSWVLPLRHYLFEGLDVTSFAGAEAYLIRHYGDSYDRLPPDKLRRISINRIDVFE